MKRIKLQKTDYSKYLRWNESLDFANKEIDFCKTNTMRLLIKSYLGIIASKYATLLNTGDIKIYTKQKIYWHNRMKLINIQE
jgi:hypothetical protein